MKRAYISILQSSLGLFLLDESTASFIAIDFDLFFFFFFFYSAIILGPYFSLEWVQSLVQGVEEKLGIY